MRTLAFEDWSCNWVVSQKIKQNGPCGSREYAGKFAATRRV